mgnify:CR=1 FL=1
MASAGAQRQVAARDIVAPRGPGSHDHSTECAVRHGCRGGPSAERNAVPVRGAALVARVPGVRLETSAPVQWGRGVDLPRMWWLAICDANRTTATACASKVVRGNAAVAVEDRRPLPDSQGRGARSTQLAAQVEPSACGIPCTPRGTRALAGCVDDQGSSQRCGNLSASQGALIGVQGEPQWQDPGRGSRVDGMMNRPPVVLISLAVATRGGELAIRNHFARKGRKVTP